MLWTLLACAPSSSLFQARELRLSVPNTSTLVMGIDPAVLTLDPAFEPLAVALEVALEDAGVIPSGEPLQLVCQSKGCFLRLQGEVLTWDREDALPAKPGHLTWSIGPGHRRQLVEQSSGVLLLGDRSAMQHTREHVARLEPQAGQDAVPVGPIWLLVLQPMSALTHVDRRLSRTPGADARRLRVALQPLPGFLERLGVELLELGMALTPGPDGLRLELRARCADAEQARSLAVALRFGMMELRRGRGAEASGALARLPIEQLGDRVDVQVGDLHLLLSEL